MKDRIVELDNGTQYYIIEELNENGKKYVLLSECNIKKDFISDNDLEIKEVVMNNNYNISVKNINDENLLNELTTKLIVEYRKNKSLQ